MLFILDYFFFFKKKTAYEMRISDWSSDVCSSDLNAGMVCAAAPIIRTAGDAARLFRARLCRRERETLIVAHLDAKRRLIRLSEETVGATGHVVLPVRAIVRSEEHTSELQSLMRISYAVFCLKKKKTK